ncbi:hypothetical protein BDY19DRAFT_996387 [Irpex rosettiformis]|uniref:Uncharacterized protein n=1 Tax=Irpex rosettiformis TaxID=378272 RepID=A0ACB8TVY4_9APHY|nr:hypothetical protein BDY19DRAFT_996387 [Irpex rosettiformis]
MDIDLYDNRGRSPSTIPGSEYSGSHHERAHSFTPEPSASLRGSPFSVAASFDDSFQSWPSDAFSSKHDFTDYSRGAGSMRPPALGHFPPSSRSNSFSTQDSLLGNIGKQLSRLCGMVQSLDSSMDEIRENQLALRSSIDNMGIDNGAPLKQLSRKDYPEARFWFKDDWLKYRSVLKDKNTANDDKCESTTLGFITERNGECVSSARLAEIRKTANGTFRMMERSHKFGLPKTWARDVDEDQCEVFAREMERRYPELRLCDNHWKADSVAIESLCHFKRQDISERPTKRKVIADELETQNTDISPPDGLNPPPHATVRHKKSKAVQKKPVASISNPLDGISFDDDTTVTVTTPADFDRGHSLASTSPQEALTSQPTVIRVNSTPLPHHTSTEQPASSSLVQPVSADVSSPIPPTPAAAPASIDVTSETPKRVVPSVPLGQEADRSEPATGTLSIPLSYAILMPYNISDDRTATLGSQVPPSPSASTEIPTNAIPANAQTTEAPTVNVTTKPSASSPNTESTAPETPGEHKACHAVATTARKVVGKVLVLKHNAPLTARNIAAIHWQAEHPEGLEKEFSEYWKLIPDKDRSVLDKEAKAMKKAGKTLGLDVTAAAYEALQKG